MLPTTHAIISWSISQPLQNRKDRIIITATSIIPDLDGLGVLFSIDFYSKYHHTIGHNLLFITLTSLVLSLFSKERKRVFLLSLISLHAHLLGDLLGSGTGWGIKYFLPFNEYYLEFAPPFHWELDRWQNLVITALLIIYVLRQGVKKERTIMEIFSLRLDQKIVQAIKKRLKCSAYPTMKG